MKTLYLLLLALLPALNLMGATGGGGGGGSVSNTYSFNGPFNVVNVTNVYLHATLSNQVMTGISPGATNAGFYIGSSNGFGTNTIFRQTTTNPALSIIPFIGVPTNRLQVLNTNGVPVVLVTSNDIFTTSNTIVRGTLQGSISISSPLFLDTDFTGAKVLVSEGTPTGELLESSVTSSELTHLTGLTTDLAAKNNNPNLTTNILGSGTVTITSNNTGGWTISGAAGSLDTTPFALLLRGTNSWADGSNNVRHVYTNVFHSTSGGLTNVYWTNLADGQTLSTWLFPSNGVTVAFPQFASTDHIDGSTITPATNIWSLVQVTRRGTFTNILVQTATYALEAGTGLTFTTNFSTRTITVTGGGVAAGSTYQVQYYSNGTFDADAPFYYVAPSNHLVISNGSSGVSIIQPQLILAAGTDGGGPRHFKFIVEDGTNRIVSQNSSSHALLLEQGAIGFYRIDTNSITPPQNGSTLFGQGVFRWRSLMGWTNDVTNLFVRGGTIGAGKVLTDASGTGEATWQDAPGGGGTNFNTIIVTNQILYNQDIINGGTTGTNLDVRESQRFVMETNLVVDATYAITNPVPAKFTVFLIGRTNSAVNHTVSFTAAGGATINWQGSGTNGVHGFTLFSNATATVYFEVSTNLTGTNISARWESDSYWPQRNASILFSAGASTSNATPDGLIYYDYAPAAYTNHSSAGANYTNLALVMLPANLLTNTGDSITAVWRGRFRGANNGTNQLIAGIGTVTNGLGDTGQFTNRANASWEYKAEVTAIGPTNQTTYWEFRVGGATTLTGSWTNQQSYAFGIGILTNGATNILRLQHKGLGAGAISNDYFKVFYQPGMR